MRVVAILLLGACGGQPLLANAPHPNNAAVAGGAAAAAAAITLAAPDAATAKPESDRDADKKPITVKERVPADVLDRLDQQQGSAATTHATAPPAVKNKPKGPPPKLPSPRDAAEHEESTEQP
ncbi:MAG TPA: hypothetical protein VLX92_04255 [Kofleriaceae bacterium]|nr:hypothetical protein [Kofleriaceae bacterium]